MGLNSSYTAFIEKAARRTEVRNFSGLRMLELGDQVAIGEPAIAEATGKERYSNMGFEHVSVDLNGLHGACVRDLRVPAQFKEWHGSFDVITNSGTSEHVEPLEQQYECFQILHDCLRVGGVAVHLVPDVHQLDLYGAWKDHCHVYYSYEFFDMLASTCDYEVLYRDIVHGNCSVALKKRSSAAFTSDRSHFLSLLNWR